jgi:hypothetical protein
MQGKPVGSSPNLPLRETVLGGEHATVAGEECDAWAEIRHVIFYYLAEHYRQAALASG